MARELVLPLFFPSQRVGASPPDSSVSKWETEAGRGQGLSHAHVGPGELLQCINLLSPHSGPGHGDQLLSAGGHWSPERINTPASLSA